MDLNQTLLHHLPSEFLLKYEGQKWWLTGLARENVYRRIKLYHPDDVLIERELVSTVNDLCSLAGGETFTQADLTRYLKYGLIVPRYRVTPKSAFFRSRHSSETGEHDTKIKLKRVFLRSRRLFVYSPDGLLEKIEIGPFLPHLHEKNKKLTYRHPEAAEPFPPFQGRIEKNSSPLSPEFRDARRSRPLFAFSQVGHAHALHQSTRWTVDLLSVTPEQYAEMRSQWVAGLKADLQKDGRPKFCENPACRTPIPLGHKRYCLPECRERAKQARTSPSTARVAKSYQKNSPLPSVNGLPMLPHVLVE